METGLTPFETSVYQIVLSCGTEGISAEEIQDRLKTQGIDVSIQEIRRTLHVLNQKGMVE